MKKEKKLTNTTIARLIGTALFFDILQPFMAFLFLDWLVGFFAFMSLWLSCKLLGISFATPKRAGIMGGGFIVEMIPFISSLPAWTLAITLIILDIKIKEALPDTLKKLGAVELAMHNKKIAELESQGGKRKS